MSPGLTAVSRDAIDVIPAVDDAVAARWPFLQHRLQDAAARGDGRRVPLPLLQSREGMAAQLHAFACQYPGQDLRGIASLWVQWYLVTVWPPLVTAALLLDACPVLDPASTALVVDDEAKPAGFALPTLAASGSAELALERLVRDHAAPVFENVAAVAGMSPRVPWSNAANVLGWFLDELQGTAERWALAKGRNLVTQPQWPDGSRNPLHNGRVGPEGPARPSRRVCCLRYRLDGFEYCADCPITSCGRGSASRGS